MAAGLASRRRFLQGSLGLAGLGLLGGCGLLPPGAQQPKRVPRIGYHGGGNAPAAGPTLNYDAFVAGLRELGWVDGQTMALETRWAEARAERIPDLVAELIGLPVDVLVTSGGSGASAAAKLTETLPIVFASAPDPVGTGLVCSLARPCGNVTGLSSLAEGLDGKRLELLREAVPGLSRVAILWRQPGMVAEYRRTQAATQVTGLQLQSLPVADPKDILAAFQAARAGAAQALVTVTDSITLGARTEILEQVAQSRLPAMYQTREFVDAGGLMAYGPNLADQYRRAATYVDKILNGAKPADLPVEQPTTFEFVINLKTAQALGLTIPPSILQQATEVIQ